MAATATDTLPQTEQSGVWSRARELWEAYGDVDRAISDLVQEIEASPEMRATAIREFARDTVMMVSRRQVRTRLSVISSDSVSAPATTTIVTSTDKNSKSSPPRDRLAARLVDTMICEWDERAPMLRVRWSECFDWHLRQLVQESMKDIRTRVTGPIIAQAALSKMKPGKQLQECMTAEEFNQIVYAARARAESLAIG